MLMRVFEVKGNEMVGGWGRNYAMRSFVSCTHLQTYNDQVKEEWHLVRTGANMNAYMILLGRSGRK
jgi:hypothetical protein